MQNEIWKVSISNFAIGHMHISYACSNNSACIYLTFTLQSLLAVVELVNSIHNDFDNIRITYNIILCAKLTQKLTSSQLIAIAYGVQEQVLLNGKIVT